MLRHVALIVCLAAAAAVTATAQRGAPPGGGGLQAELQDMTARLGASGPTPRDAIANAQWIVGRYRSFGPLVRTYGPADYALSREMARRSLDWLWRAGTLHARDPLAVRAVLDAYDAVGLFYRDYGRFYAPGAYVAYASAARLAQRLTFYRTDPLWFAQAFDRYALAYGTLAAASGMIVPRWTRIQDLPDADTTTPDAAPALVPVPLPKVDANALGEGERTKWTATRDRFRSVSANVHTARVLLDQLSQRLRRQGLALNPETAATALKMQSALEDAAELIAANDFDTAVEALRGAEAYRARLKGATGQ